MEISFKRISLLLGIWLFGFVPAHFLAQESRNIALLKDTLNRTEEVSQVIRLSNKISFAYLVENLDSCLSYAEKARTLAFSEGDSAGLTHSLHNLSLYRYYRGQFAEAYEFSLKAVEMADAVGKPKLRSACYNDLGMIERERGNYKNSLISFMKTLELNEEMADSMAIASSLMNMGLVWENLFEFEKACQHYQDAMAIARSIRDTTILLYALNNLGAAHDVVSKNSDSAYLYFSQALELSSSYSRSSPYLKAALLHNIGEILVYEQKIEEARSYLERALKIAEENRFGAIKLTIMGTMAKILLVEKRYKEAIEMARENYGQAMAQEVEFILPNFLETLHRGYEGLGRHDSAYAYLLRYSLSKDSLKIKQQDKEVKGMISAYDLAKKEQELTYQKTMLELKERQNRGLYIMLMAAVLGIMGLAYLGFRLRLAKKVVDHVNFYVEKQNQELEELNQFKNRMLSVISHDIRTPLNNMSGLGEILLEGSVEEKERKFLAAELKKQAEEASSIIDNLLLWSRSQLVEAHNPVVLDLCPFIKEGISRAQLAASRKNIHLNVSLEDCPKVKVDEAMLQSILRNLLSNAIKFSPPGSEVCVRSWVEEGRAWFSVEDKGVGIEPSRMDGLFDLQKNVSTLGTANERGTGLGLPLTAEFVRINQGKIGGESELGKGSRFWVGFGVVPPKQTG